MTSKATRPETIERLEGTSFSALAMLAGMQLDVFSTLEDGPRTTDEVAAALGVGPIKLAPLLYALVAAGLLTVEGDRFSNTAEAGEFLVKGLPGYRGGRHTVLFDRWTAFLKTADSISEGSAQAKVDFSAMSPDEAESNRRRWYSITYAAGKDLMERRDFSGYRSLADVAGGSGALSIAITEGHPQLKATVIDQPNVAEAARRFVKEAAAENRVEAAPADVVNGPLTGSYDVVVMRAFIQVLTAEDARKALKNVAGIVKPGGDLLILGRVLDDSRISPIDVVTHNLGFINVYDGGQAYTEGEYREWLAEAGFEDFSREVIPDAMCLITARKPA